MRGINPSWAPRIIYHIFFTWRLSKEKVKWKLKGQLILKKSKYVYENIPTKTNHVIHNI